MGEFRFGNPGFDGLTTKGTEGHRGPLGLCAFGVGLGTLVVHSPRFTQVDFSVKVRCHKKKINIGWGCGKLLGRALRLMPRLLGCVGGGRKAVTTRDTKVHEGNLGLGPSWYFFVVSESGAKLSLLFEFEL